MSEEEKSTYQTLFELEVCSRRWFKAAWGVEVELEWLWLMWNKSVCICDGRGGKWWELPQVFLAGGEMLGGVNSLRILKKLPWISGRELKECAYINNTVNSLWLSSGLKRNLVQKILCGTVYRWFCWQLHMMLVDHSLVTQAQLTYWHIATKKDSRLFKRSWCMKKHGQPTQESVFSFIWHWQGMTLTQTCFLTKRPDRISGGNYRELQSGFKDNLNRSSDH